MPLRRDLLHRAIVYEGDNTRQGTASTKWRDDVHGSHRKVHPQKGSGRARAGDKQSPIRKGGGVAHGPHPRDFSTDLPKKIYDQAWRVALSYRYQRGELIVINNKIRLPSQSTPFLFENILHQNGWDTKKGRSTFITEKVDEELFDKVEKMSRYATIMDRSDVDVKNLLETQRLIIERVALNRILKDHSLDLKNRPAKATY
jgi:large subunit ribosomal protein L4